MYELIKTVHSWWAYIVLIVLGGAIINATVGFFSNREYKQRDFRLHLFGLVVTHIQLLLGVVLYFITPYFDNWSYLGAGVMKDPFLRKMLVEHPFGVVLGVTLITIGWSLHKKQKTSKKAFGKIAFFYILGLIAILGVIPWALWGITV